MPHIRCSMLLLLLALTACTSPAERKPEPVLTRFEFEHPQMGTTFRIVVYGEQEPATKAAADAAFARIDALNATLSDYVRDSELSKLSDSAGSGQWVAVSDDLWNVMRVSHELSVKSGGAFDITVGSVVQLWRWARRNRALPSQERIDAAVKAVGFEKIEYDPKGKRVRLSAPNMRLDVGAIGKGYACEDALAILKKAGFSRAMIDCGSSTVVGDAPPGRKGWRIGIASLNPREVPPSKYVILTNAGICTSGDAWQFVEIEGKRYSHIVDPKTGVGMTDHSSVTVVTPAGVLPDGISTAVAVLGPEKGLKFIEGLKGVAAFIVRKPGEEIEVFESSAVKELVIEAPKE